MELAHLPSEKSLLAVVKQVDATKLLELLSGDQKQSSVIFLIYNLEDMIMQ